MINRIVDSLTISLLAILVVIGSIAITVFWFVAFTPPGWILFAFLLWRFYG